MRDRRLLFEFAFRAVSNAVAMVVVGVTLFILGLVFVKGIGGISFAFLTSPPTGTMDGGGIGPMILGTAWLVILMSLMTVPLGAIIAVYLNEIATRNWLYNTVMSSVRTLAAVPSIVFGLFGLAFFVTVIGGGLDWLFGYEERVFQERCLLWAALTMGTLTLPTNVISVSEALKLVPDEQRHAGICLGYTRWEVVKWVVLPQAVGGILTGLVLSVSRGAGEVAPILFVGVAYFLPHFTGDVLDQFMELGYHIYVMATQSPNVDETLPIQYATTLVLLTLTFGFNSIGQVIRWMHRKKMSR
ncbi:MAG: phosphate ABC transporter permease PstA [Nitrospinae bacterium]|nr:phosphate ABC transporter permease PstA [Nitrospinota bacterium]